MMKIDCGVMLALMALPNCSPSRSILGYGETDETGSEQDQEQTDSSTGEEDGDSTTEYGGMRLDVEDEPEPSIELCDRVDWLAHPHISELVGPTHHDGRIYWAEWGQDDEDPVAMQTWREQDLHIPKVTDLHASASPPSHSLVVDEHYLYASGLDRNPLRLPVEGGIPESIPAPPGYAESSSELLLQADHMYWLNHSMDEITLMRTQLEPLATDVLLDGPLGGQLGGSEEAGLFVLRPAGSSTDILRVDPLFGISEELINLAAPSEDVGELYAVQDELYVVYTSAGTAQIDLVTLEGDVTAIVDPGTYTLITHPVVWQDQLYFELADPEFGWGRVGIGGNTVEALGPTPEWYPGTRWQPMFALENCLVVRMSFPILGNNFTFEINTFPE